MTPSGPPRRRSQASSGQTQLISSTLRGRVLHLPDPTRGANRNQPHRQRRASRTKAVSRHGVGDAICPRQDARLQRSLVLRVTFAGWAPCSLGPFPLARDHVPVCALWPRLFDAVEWRSVMSTIPEPTMLILGAGAIVPSRSETSIPFPMTRTSLAPRGGLQPPPVDPLPRPRSRAKKVAQMKTIGRGEVNKRSTSSCRVVHRWRRTTGRCLSSVYRRWTLSVHLLRRLFCTSGVQHR